MAAKYKSANIRTGVRPNPVARVNLFADKGQWIFKKTRRPYVGQYHIMSDGIAMIGLGKSGEIYSINEDNVIVKSTEVGNTRPNLHRRNNISGRYSKKQSSKRSSTSSQRKGLTSRMGTTAGRSYRRGGIVTRRRK